jgi:hypothetical protein
MLVSSLTVTKDGEKNFMTWLKQKYDEKFYNEVVSAWGSFCEESVPRVYNQVSCCTTTC